jgi:predicted CopG family antitoxin
MVTTIQVSGDLLKRLKELKISGMESYESVIWDLVEDRAELSDETKEAIASYEKDVADGNWENFVNFDAVKKGIK